MATEYRTPVQMKTSLIDSNSAEDGARPLLYRISVVMRQLAVSRTTIYRMVSRGELEMVKISARSSRITSASVAKVATKNPAEDVASTNRD